MASKNINAEKIQGNLTISAISATTYYNLPLDIRVTGGTYNNGTATFTNNTGGTFNVVGFNTGSTVTGTTVFTAGLSASTISAATYYNLPLDIRVTGGTYNNGTATFTNNTGGTFNVVGFSAASSTFSGGTVTGPTNFTNGLTATTISATTYSNLPLNTGNAKITFVSASTYTATTSDYIILGDMSVSPTIYLPSVSSCPNKIYEFGWYNYQNEVFTGVYSIVPSAGDTFDTPQSISSLPCYYDGNSRITTKIISNGVKWHILQSSYLGMTLP